MCRFRSVLAVCILSLLCGSAWSQAYPSRTIKLIFPFAPGSSAEVVTRMLAQRLSDSLKQPVVIENRPGAGSVLGTDAVAKSPPDGYTLIASFNSAIAPGPLMHTEMPYDPITDFTHIALLGVFPQFFVVRTDYPAKSLAEFLAIAKAKPGTINYASAGVGTAGYLSGELLKRTGKYEMTHVPYKGPAPAIADLLGGRLDMVITANAAELVRAGKVRILATTGQRRSKDYPDVPTVNEIVPGVVAASWLGISAPAKTPHAIVEKLQAEILAIARAEDFQARASDPAIGMAPLPLDSEKFLGFIQNEIRTWTPVIKAGNIKIN